MKRRLWQNILVIFISLGGASLFGYRLYSDLYLSKRSYGGHTPAGTLRDKIQTVRRKFNDNMIFDSLTAKDTLYWNDSIQTAEHSAATIELDGGSRINLGASSLVVLEKDNEGLSLNLKSGQLVIDPTGGGTNGARLKVNGADITGASGEKVALQMDADKGQLTAVTKTTDGTAKEITVDRQGHLEEKMMPATLLDPPPLARRYSKLEITNQKFRWALQNKPDGKNLEMLQLSKNAAFTEIVTQKAATNHEASVDLNSGTYFWRVKLKGPDQHDMFSETRTLDVLPTSPPLLKNPKPNETFTVKTDYPTVDFNWTSKAPATKYIFEIASDPEFRNTLFKDETTNTAYRTSKLADGRLFWRVTALFGDESFISSSEIQILRQKEIIAPELLFPEKNFQVTLDYFQQAGGIHFKWKTDANEISHFIFAKRSNLTDPLLAFDTAQSETLVKETVQPGTYYWAVALKDQSGQWKYQDARPIEIGPLAPLPAAPSTVGPAANSDLDLLANPKVTWSWKPVDGAKEYHFKLLKIDEKTQKIIMEDKIKGVEEEKKDLPDGAYKWLVSSVDDYGRESAAVTSSFTVRHGKTLDAPSFDMSEVQ